MPFESTLPFAFGPPTTSVLTEARAELERTTKVPSWRTTAAPFNVTLPAKTITPTPFLTTLLSVWLPVTVNVPLLTVAAPCRDPVPVHTRLPAPDFTNPLVPPLTFATVNVPAATLTPARRSTPEPVLSSEPPVLPVS